ncbi:hypothetical protein N7520_008595 [Penicillium odoratum]|uniref:uncharacterized protein n=1 Tax=Penicillium odoratum TaxID=1167516 RepID=UPI0025480F61|nr:uncharacterized protein N7520_008595 [Penicillium odoratum]KAJ5751678.1 hypothetical protein N7520_008595 [Penicillium odoratum]
MYHIAQEALQSSKDDQTREGKKKYLEAQKQLCGLQDVAENPDKEWNIEDKLKRLLRFKHPEPGTAFSYEEWKTNRHNDRAIIEIPDSSRALSLHQDVSDRSTLPRMFDPEYTATAVSLVDAGGR